ncbi:putative oxidoreductase [Peribacillus deserti]|uniref:Oxidoreductase n=1 Tax=Peribacillus deserti TaxID=673318 RepID=A0ABS2QI66_9BACI|nr:DoxX family protein [Peribacillus deserti]MBM7692715.1 putative oxidoreductase [Peribacillus deserti]
MLDAGLLIIRLVIGLALMAHGAQKLFGWFGGYGLKGTGQWMESLGLKPGYAMALLAGLSEFAGGFLFASGIFTVAGSILIIATMLVAIIKVHGANGFWVTQNGYEFNLILIAVVLGVALTGPGAYTLL